MGRLDANALLASIANVVSKHALLEGLKQWERDALALHFNGKSNKEIAEVLGLYEKDVQGTISEFIRRCGTSDMNEGKQMFQDAGGRLDRRDLPVSHGLRTTGRKKRAQRDWAPASSPVGTSDEKSAVIGSTPASDVHGALGATATRETPSNLRVAANEEKNMDPATGEAPLSRDVGAREHPEVAMLSHPTVCVHDAPQATETAPEHASAAVAPTSTESGEEAHDQLALNIWSPQHVTPAVLARVRTFLAGRATVTQQMLYTECGIGGKAAPYVMKILEERGLIGPKNGRWPRVVLPAAHVMETELVQGESACTDPVATDQPQNHPVQTEPTTEGPSTEPAEAFTTEELVDLLNRLDYFASGFSSRMSEFVGEIIRRLRESDDLAERIAHVEATLERIAQLQENR